MADIIDVANCLLQAAREDEADGDGNEFNCMKLQQLLYYCQGYSLALYGRPLFDDPIEAWPEGPVCPSIQSLLRFCGAHTPADDGAPLCRATHSNTSP